MNITLHPFRSDLTLSLSRAGDTLILNGGAFDFSDLSEGASLPADATGSDWFVLSLTRKDGVLHAEIRLPHGADAPQETLYPAPLILTEDGPVSLPAHSNPAPPDPAEIPAEEFPI